MAAVGDVVNHFTGTLRKVWLLVNATANTTKPALSTDGVACYSTVDERNKEGKDVGVCFPSRDAGQSTLMVKGTVDAGQTLTGTLTLWGYSAELGEWIEVPTNGGTAVTPVALAETDTDKITYSQRFENLGHYDRLALQLTGIGGTGASFSAVLVTGRYAE